MPRPPSPALLSILAILATTNGSPSPLSFLCPSFEKRRYIPPPTITSHIPNKYVQCDDGLWRRAESYTLYGSTFPCTSACLPTQVTSSNDNDDQLQVSGDPTSSTPTDDIRDSLPLGWKPIPKTNERPALILALSLVLAFFICFFIIGCVFWRKNVLKRRTRDLEAKFKKRQSPSAAEEAKNVVEKESKAKHKILARATARWRVNLRHTPRQRKGKRVAASKPSQPHQSSHSLNNPRSRLALSLPSHSRPSSRRSSVVSLPDELPHPTTGELLTSMSLSHDTISTTAISPHTNVPISPPAYHHGGQTPLIIYSNVSHATSLDQQSSSFRAGIDPHSSTRMSFHAAHVATDDKALLARLADLASRPPEDASIDTLDSCDIHVSAPAWHDELEEIPPDLMTSSDHPSQTTCPSSSLFPPPPSKERMNAEDFYEYPFSFEDMAALEPESEPSAPPFHVGSPLLDDDQIVPSAPPLDDTEFLADVHPRAPQWDSTSCQFDVSEEHPTGQDHDRLTSASGLPSSTNVLSGSQPDIATGDDIALPGYRP